MSDDHGQGGDHGGGSHASGGGGSWELVKRALAVVVAIAVVTYIINSMESSYNRQVSGIPTQGGQYVSDEEKKICNGLSQAVTYGSKPVMVNPNGLCYLELWYKECIFVQQFQSTIPQRRCPKDKPEDILPTDIQYVWSAGKPFEGSYKLHPHKYTNFFEIRS